MRNKKLLLGVLLLLAIGFATVTTTLIMTGNVKIATNDRDFNVRFTKAILDGTDISSTVISGDGKSITFGTNNLTTVGDISKLDFEVTNNSELYDAEVSIDCSATGEKSNYYSIYKEVATPIEAKTTGTGKVEVTLSKASVEDIHEEFTCTLSATAKERTTEAEVPETHLGPTLYKVLQDEAKSGGVAKEYRGAHQDSFNRGVTKKIYHYYAESDAEAVTILNKNNVIFAGHCWQMIRTTDTGGVKMIYNGEAVDNKCLSTRGTHVGYASRTYQNLASNYWYGTDYIYDSTAKTFKVSGTTEQVTWNATTGPGLVGKYTCKSTSVDDSCATLYLVESYYNTSSAYVIPLNSNSHYSQFGTLSFNPNLDSPSGVGYMYNTGYTSKSMPYSSSGKLEVAMEAVDYGGYTIKNNDSTYPYEYDETTKQWSSSNHADSSKSVFEFSPTIAGEYYLSYTIGSDGRDYAMFYVDGTLKGTVSGSNNLSIISLGSLTPDSVIKVEYSKDGYANTSPPDKVSFSLATGSLSADNRWYFGSDVTYENGAYTLVNPKRFDLSYEHNKINNNHYTCNGKGEGEQTPTTTCTTVKYIYYTDESTSYYIELTEGKKVENALNEMLYDNNVNKTNSTMKIGVDAWYKHYMLDYDEYIEDTIFCNDRSINNKEQNGWNPNGGSTSTYMSFGVSDLSCPNDTDKFSVSNNKAKLTYKVGLMSYPEMNLLNNFNVRKTGTRYWLGSPYLFGNDFAGVGFVCLPQPYDLSYNGSAYPFGVRPAVSLTPDIEYSDGDGSMENPYKVSTQ